MPCERPPSQTCHPTAGTTGHQVHKASQRSGGRTIIIRVVAFLATFAVLLTAYESSHGTGLSRWIIEDATVGTAGRIIAAFDPSAGVVAMGPRLVAVSGGLNVLAGCEGVDVALLLVSAMLIAPIPARARLIGIATGLLVVFALNQGRIIALFYANRIDRELFSMMHAVLAPMLLVLAIGAFFGFWVRRSWLRDVR